MTENPTPHAGRMPALYIGHGAPPLLDDPLWSSQLAAWSRDLPGPPRCSSSPRTGRPPRSA